MMNDIPYKNQLEFKRKLESMRCHKHGKNAIIELTNNGINISNCCCEEFKVELSDELKKILNDYFSSKIKDIFKGLS